MRRKIFSALLLTTLFALLTTTELLAQFPGGGSGGFGGGRGRGNFDPSKFVDYMFKDKNEIDIATAPFFFRGRLEEFAKKANITNGKITRDQFKQYMDERKAQMEQGQGRPGSSSSSSSSAPASSSSAGSSNSSGSSSSGESEQEKAERLKRMTDEYFERRDNNKDGVLDQSEMSDRMRENLKEHDKNGDGKISREEAAGYMQGWVDRRSQDGNNNSSSQSAPGINALIIQEVPQDRPLVYRPGNLPKGLPEWFASGDSDDNDGQIGLYEWRKGGKSLDEFNRWDLNQDGFLTPDEVIRAQSLVSNDSSGPGPSGSFAETVGGGAGQQGGGFGQRPSFGGFGQRGMGGTGGNSRGNGRGNFQFRRQ
jgi:hypothetical protein